MELPGCEAGKGEFFVLLSAELRLADKVKEV